ncbi:MAG: biotin/lipoyl-binding protein [candidate division Zixibacteria bacterium]|nr:biotin/lipoyl-binding protein [candidate division Zixibacteria bacterium]
MIYNVKVDDKDFKIEVIEGQKNLKVKFNGRTIKLDDYKASSGRMTTLLQDNQPFEFEIFKENSAYYCWHGSRVAYCEVISEKTARYSKLMGNSVGAGRTHILKAPMPGLIVRIEVKPGQQVRKGDGLIIVEAMKMENELKASHSGTIKDIKIEVGAAVDKNQPLIEFE